MRTSSSASFLRGETCAAGQIAASSNNSSQSKLSSVSSTKLEKESSPFQLLVFVRTKAEQLRRAMAAGHPGFLERDKQAEFQDFLAEVALVQLRFQHGLVKMLELRESELRRQQLEADRLITDFAFQPGQCGREDVSVVERQLGRIRNRKPTGVGSVGGGLGAEVRQFDQGVVCHTHDALARVAIDRAESVELFEKDAPESGLL